MSIKPYTVTIIPDMSAVDFTGRMKPSAALRAMQETAGEQCDALGLGFGELRGIGLAWVLTRLHLVIDEYPRYMRPLNVTTWPTAPRHGFFPRQFTFTADGRELGRATSIYTLIDIETRKLAPASRLPFEAPVADEPAVLPFPGNIPSPAVEAQSCIYSPVYEDIDMNGHVNNARYADWFSNKFNCEWHAAHELAGLTVHYDREARPDEPLTLDMYNEGDMSVMRGHAGGEGWFALCGLWRRRG